MSKNIQSTSTPSEDVENLGKYLQHRVETIKKRLLEERPNYGDFNYDLGQMTAYQDIQKCIRSRKGVTC